MNILLTSAGRRSYIVDYFKECRGVDKVYASNSEYTIALKRADGYLLSPLIYDPEYIPALIRYCKEMQIGALLSLFDIDLLVLARHREDFEAAGIRLVLAPASFVEICNDKWKTFEFVRSLGLKTPRTWLKVEEVLRAIASGEAAYPILMKPRWGMASMGIYKVENEQELRVLSEKCRREIFSSYLKYESGMTPDESIIYQEVMVGQEYGLDLINDLEGRPVATFAKQKVTMRSGETDLGRTADPSPFLPLAQKIAEESHHEGILSVDCFKCSDGIYIIEMNCRISGHYPLAHLAGVNYPQQLVDWLHGLPTNPENLRFESDLYIIKDLTPTVLYARDNAPAR